MQINKIQQNNQPNFGIKFVNKNAWNKEVLKVFEGSKLLKDIDAKYPKAELHYIKMSGEESMINDELIHTLIMDIKLAKDKLYRWTLSSHKEYAPEKELIKDVPNMTLKEIENSSVEKLMPLTTIEVFTKKQNPIKEFFKKLFFLN